MTHRGRILLTAAAGLVALVAVGSWAVSRYVDWLWFGAIGYRSVYLTVLLTQLVLFAAAAVFVGGLVAVNVALAYRHRPVFVPESGPDDPLAAYRTMVVGRLIRSLLVPALITLAGRASGWPGRRLARPDADEQADRKPAGKSPVAAP